MNAGQAIIQFYEVFHKKGSNLGRSGTPPASTNANSPISRVAVFRYLNDSIRQLTDHLDQDVMRQQDFTITSTTSGYIMPANWVEIIGIVTQGWTLVRSNEAIRESSQTGLSTFWQSGNKLFFSADGASVTFRVQVNDVSDLIHEGDVLPFGDRWHTLIVNKAVLLAIDEMNFDARPRLEDLVAKEESRFGTQSKTNAPIKFKNIGFTERLYCQYDFGPRNGGNNG